MTLVPEAARTLKEAPVLSSQVLQTNLGLQAIEFGQLQMRLFRDRAGRAFGSGQFLGLAFLAIETVVHNRRPPRGDSLFRPVDSFVLKLN